MRKSSRSSAAFSSRGLWLVALLLASQACGPHYPSGSTVHGDAACARVDSFLASTFPRPASTRGHATLDAESYRVRGRFELRLSPGGDSVFEFSGSTLLGGHREDIVVSLIGDTLRVLDRERGRYYEGEDAERLVDTGSGGRGAWTLAMRRVLAAGCPGVDAVAGDPDGLSGAGPDGPFRLRAEAGRLVAGTWPNPAPSETYRDRLEVRYRWGNGALRELEARLPTRGWRVRLEPD